MYHNPTRRCQKRQSEQVARVNAPESAQIGRPNLKATRRNVDALSKVRQNWYVYFRDGAFTFARYDFFPNQKSEASQTRFSMMYSLRSGVLPPM